MLAFLNSSPSIAVIWDFRAGSLLGLSRDELRQIVDASKLLLERRRGGRTAIVVGTALDFGMGRMFQIFGELERLPIEHLITRDIDEAHTWVLAAGSAAPRPS